MPIEIECQYLTLILIIVTCILPTDAFLFHHDHDCRRLHQNTAGTLNSMQMSGIVMYQHTPCKTILYQGGNTDNNDCVSSNNTNMMNKENIIFIATSLDGYIADKNGGIDWLQSIPNPDNDDMGYVEFSNGIDALVMGRITFETVLGFDVDWPYNKPVFVLSNKLNKIPESHKDKAFLAKGTLTEILDQINEKGFNRLYIDGGTTIQNFLREDLIDEMMIATIPVLLGGGSLLFGELPHELTFKLIGTKTYLNQITQNHYKRDK
jgi:dihydrofolate reductase